jgi:hypothetical protein
MKRIALALALGLVGTGMLLVIAGASAVTIVSKLIPVRAAAS